MASNPTKETAVYEQPSVPALPAPPVPGAKARKETSTSSRRLFWILMSVVLLAISIGGFYYVALRADPTRRVVITASDITAGMEVSAEHFKEVRVTPNDEIDFLPANNAPDLYGMVARGYIPSGIPVKGEMFVAAVSDEEAGFLEVVVPLDTSLEDEELSASDYVLMIDPGESPGEGDGLPRPPFIVTHRALDGLEEGQLRLMVPIEEWSRWRRLVDFNGQPPQVMKVPQPLLYDDAALEDWISRLQTVFDLEFEEELEEYVAQSEAEG